MANTICILNLENFLAEYIFIRAELKFVKNFILKNPVGKNITFIREPCKIDVDVENEIQNERLLTLQMIE